MNIILFVLLTACGNTVKSDQVPQSSLSEASIQYTVIRVEGGWGYEIIKNGHVIIHQAHIPAIEGRQAFKDSLQALSTAQLITEKIKKNIMPPSVSLKELDSLGILQ
ncbi:MAG: DUF4907 domain-containing protein [Bacteroidales bacterium]|nr:DUF4907 domain-containing protein [Bacteroidales bacterium]